MDVKGSGVSKRSNVLAIACAASAAVIGASWLFLQARSDGTSSDADRSKSSPVTVTRPERKASGDARTAPKAHALQDPPADRPFAEIRPELERRAAAGDASAARRLGLVLATCNHYTPISNEMLENMVVDVAAHGVTVRDNGRTLAPEELVDRAKLNLAQKSRDCKGVSGLNEGDALQRSFEWIERGAQLGDADAQALYGALAFSSLDSRTALAEAERIRDRKNLAIGYLQSSLAQGDALGLLQLSAHYSAGDLYPASAETAFAYLYAYSLTSRSSDLVPELLAQMLATSAATLDEETQERARIQGLQLAACCGVAVQESQ